MTPPNICRSKDRHCWNIWSDMVLCLRMLEPMLQRVLASHTVHQSTWASASLIRFWSGSRSGTINFGEEATPIPRA